MVIGLQIGKLHRGAESAPPPPLPDIEKPGLFSLLSQHIDFSAFQFAKSQEF